MTALLDAPCIGFDHYLSFTTEDGIATTYPPRFDAPEIVNVRFQQYFMKTSDLFSKPDDPLPRFVALWLDGYDAISMH